MFTLRLIIHKSDCFKNLMIAALLMFFISSQAQTIKPETNFNAANDTVNLNVFIGKKISLTQFDPNLNNKIKIVDSITGDTIVRQNYIMDYAFKAKYAIIKNVFNDLGQDTVTFNVYNHYGRPAFENYEYVLLYISLSENGKYYLHQKYISDEIIKVKKGMYEGKNGESLNRLFNEKKSGVLKARGIF